MAEGGGKEQATSAPAGTPDVFISYASQDSAVANATLEALEKQGIRCWIAPRDVTPGAHYADSIIRAITGAKAMVLVLSDSALESKHVGKEVERASSKGRPIIALRTSTAPLPPAFEYFLSESQWIDVGAGGVAGVAAKLIEAVRSHLSQSVAGAPQARAGLPIAPRRMAAQGTKWMLAAGVSIPLLVLAYFAVSRLWPGKPTPAHSPPSAMPSATAHAAADIPEKSVAVLPFVDMSEKKDQEYFSDGLSEELIDLLARVPGLTVPARTSSFHFKGMSTEIPDIAKELRVRHVLEGSVRKSGNQLRVTVQLVRADNGYHLWSETYNRNLRDVFKMQDDIAGAVVRALKVALLADSKPRPTLTVNTDAYTLYLQARELFQRGTATDYQSAYEHLVQAVQLDPRFSAAWSDIARVRVRQYFLGQMPMAQAAPEAHNAIERALQLDPQLAEAHLTKGRVLYFFDWDWQGADAEMKHALLLDPSIGECYRWASITARTLGRFDEAQSLLQQALARDPLEAFSYAMMSGYLMQKGEWSEALKAGARAHDLMPQVWGEGYIAEIALARGDPQAALAAVSRVKSPIEFNSLKARAFRALGRNADADAAIAELEKSAATDAPAEIARVYALRGERDSAFKWLDRAYHLRDSTAADIKGNPDFNNLKTDPRYAAFLRKMRLPQ